MANGIYDAARAAFLNADIDWAADDIRAILVDTGAYTVNLATHDFLDDIPGGARVATSAALSGKSSTAGVADANDVTFSAVTGATVEAVVLYKHTGVEATSNLIAYMDTGMTGLPVTPNGGDITVQWANTTNRIFKL
jgi:hypothetical protein